jgi:hypothetical protein
MQQFYVLWETVTMANIMPQKRLDVEFTYSKMFIHIKFVSLLKGKIKTLSANECYKILLGDRPCQRCVKSQRFGDSHCFHHQGQGSGTLTLIMETERVS